MQEMAKLLRILSEAEKEKYLPPMLAEQYVELRLQGLGRDDALYWLNNI